MGSIPSSAFLKTLYAGAPDTEDQERVGLGSPHELQLSTTERVKVGTGGVHVHDSPTHSATLQLLVAGSQ